MIDVIALPLLVVAGLEAWFGTLLPLWAGVWLYWAGASTAFVGLAYLFDRPRWLLKERWARVVLLPYLLFSAAVAAGAQRLGLAERQEVVPGLWVGAWPRRGAPGFAQLDLTAELPRRGEADHYRSIPMLDGAGPRREDWEAAVEQAVAWRQQDAPVLVHCAYGHGRSVAVIMGVLVRERLAHDAPSALAIVRRVRPRARLAPAQARLMNEFLGG
ncbi:MAG: hypothetical protein EXR71_13905 [Myxococcales bacterium]|nr:hypothetical protein [Myxococcales bacterium]